MQFAPHWGGFSLWLLTGKVPPGLLFKVSIDSGNEPIVVHRNLQQPNFPSKVTHKVHTHSCSVAAEQL